MSISRRSALIFGGVLAVPLSFDARAQFGAANYSDRATTDKWMEQWMLAPHAATEPLYVGRFADRIYFLISTIGWQPNPGQIGPKSVQVPVGFVTDFASIPQVFWSLLPPDGTYTYAAIIHDYLYWEQPVSKAEADEILRLAMEDFKVNSAAVLAIYQGVHLGGQAAWDGNAKLKATGERRVLKKYPTNPTTRWADWKLKPEVFS